MPYITPAPTMAAATGIIHPAADPGAGVGGWANSVNCVAKGRSKLSTGCLSESEQTAMNRSKDELAKIDRLNQLNKRSDETTRDRHFESIRC